MSSSDEGCGCGCGCLVILVVGAVALGYFIWDRHKSGILEGAATLIEKVDSTQKCKDPTWVKEKGEWVKHCSETPLETKVDPFL